MSGTSVSAVPRSSRLSSPGQVVAILIASAVFWVAVVTTVIVLFVNVFIPAVTLGGKGEIPADFPIYPGAHLQSALASNLGNCTTVDATWSTPDAPSSVISFYEDALATGAWSLTDTTRHLGSIELYFTSISGPHREGLLTVGPGPVQSSPTYFSLELYKLTGTANANCRVLQTST